MLCPQKYYSAPSPVRHPSEYFIFLSLRDSIAFMQYAWFWLTLFSSLLLYSPRSLLHLGIIPTGRKWYLPRADLTIRQRQSAMDNGHQGFQRSPVPQQTCGSGPPCMARVVCYSMSYQLLRSRYPIVYSILTLPNSAVRFLRFPRRARLGHGRSRPLSSPPSMGSTAH